ncbi:FAD binding domain-containing protein [Immundisolibacter sp.]|uniref:FAD binding domain-containing protein n=1 Tax=Immundisolibacter sp. TaxID=1934948 RepID=UPI0026093EEE|nr:FAD binding domain-containing protein [Immundisolibacter sp.]MDD3650217.1 FAD binding domain-containing protein [Immundisolibacter sp.]
MRGFDFKAPDSLDGVCALLSEYGSDAKLLAGGTGLLNLMKQELVQPAVLVSLQRVPGLDGLTVDDTGIRAGAFVRHRRMETDPAVQRAQPLLAAAYGRVATVRIRMSATVGGGLAHADPAMDAPAVWKLLGATLHARSARGMRQIPAAEFFEDFYTTNLAPDEVLTEVTAPPPPAGSGWSYHKFLPRSADDYAAVSVAALVALDGDGKVTQARVGIGSAAPIPVLAEAAGNALVGEAPTPQTIATAAELVRDAIDPLDDLRGSAAYKRDMAVVFTRRALAEAAARATRA